MFQSGEFELMIVAVVDADWAVVAHSAGQDVPVGPLRCSATKPFAFDTG